jgi:hypothetical protein
MWERTRREAFLAFSLVGLLGLVLAVVRVTWWDPEVPAWPVAAGAAAGVALGAWPAARLRRRHRAGGTFETGKRRPVRSALVYAVLWPSMMFTPPPVSAGVVAALGAFALTVAAGIALP